MAILPDHRLQDLGPSLVHPFDPSMVQPASIDLHLDKYFYRARSDGESYLIDASMRNDTAFEGLLEVHKGAAFWLEPEGFALASTFEKVTIPDNLVARFEGKSSLGRLGLMTHVTAGFIDPGFQGHITLELKNVTALDWRLMPGMKIGQICFEELTSNVRHPYGYSGYGSHYQGQRGPTLSRSQVNFSTVNVY